MSPLLEEALSLAPIDRLHLVDELLLSLDIPSKEIDKEWSQEVEKRINEHEKGKIQAVPAHKVFAKYK